MMAKAKVNPAISLSDLQIKVERYVLDDAMTYTEAICEICDKMELDPLDIAKIISGPLKEKLEVEAIERNIIKSNTARLY